MEPKTQEKRRSSLTRLTDFTIPRYSVCSARAEHISALSAIELAAAQLLRGYSPESVLSENTDDLPHLEELDVDPSHGRRGLGTALVRAVCEWATVSGYVVLTLTTFRAVPWNLPFYARLGFVEIPRETLRPELSAVISEEAHRGLNADTRVVMGYRCEPPVICE